MVKESIYPAIKERRKVDESASQINFYLTEWTSSENGQPRNGKGENNG